MAGRIQISSSGGTGKIQKFLKMAGRTDEIIRRIKPVCEQGVRALEAATPRDTGLTAGSWSYEIVKSGDGIRIDWKNNNVNQGQIIAVLIRYGHGTRNGGYVPARDFITPALQPIFDKISTEAWKAVTRA